MRALLTVRKDLVNEYVASRAVATLVAWAQKQCISDEGDRQVKVAVRDSHPLDSGLSDLDIYLDEEWSHQKLDEVLSALRHIAPSHIHICVSDSAGTAHKW